MWTQLSATQERIYRNFLESERVRELLNTTRSPLAALTVLKKICDHPDLLANYLSYKAELGLDQSKSEVLGEDAVDGLDEFVPQLLAQQDSSAAPKDVAALVSASGKLQLLVLLMKQLYTEGHRCLIFSQSRIMLDLVTKVLAEYSMLRIDGTVSDPQVRQQRVDKFNKDTSIFCFLLTTQVRLSCCACWMEFESRIFQVGGVGLNLVGADRVVIIDPSWNPATDAQVCQMAPLAAFSAPMFLVHSLLNFDSLPQAVDRAYRLGQTRDVTVYRFITCGTVEEKIYRRQVSIMLVCYSRLV